MEDQNTPLLSIIVPVYNVENLLSRCIDSVLEQEYQHWELLLVSDGSTDGSLQVCRQYADRDARIRVFSQENAGQSVARNRALDEARGAYVCMLDSDDAIEPQTYNACIKILEADKDCDFVEFGYVEFRRTGEIGHTFDYGSIDGAEEIVSAWLDKKISWLTTNKLYRASLFEEVRFLPGVWLEDNLVMAQIVTQCRRIRSCQDGRYLYYQLEFDPAKYEWTPRHEHDQAIVNREIFRHFASLAPRFLMARAFFAARITNHYQGAYQSEGRQAAAVQILMPVFQEIRFQDFLWSDLTLKPKIKILLTKLHTNCIQIAYKLHTNCIQIAYKELINLPDETYSSICC